MAVPHRYPVTRPASVGYPVAAGLAMAAMLLPMMWRDFLGPRVPISLGLAAVALGAFVGGTGPGLLATVLSAAGLLYLYIEPFASFRLEHPGDALFICLFLAVGAAISFLSGAMRRARDRSDSLLGSIADAYYALAPDWTFLDMNGRAAEFFGRRRGEMIGRSIWDALPGCRGGEFERTLRRAVERGEPVTFEVRSGLDAGRWVEIRAYPSAAGLTVFFADVTSRRRSDEDLRRHRDVTRAITDNAAEALFLLDAAGRVTFMNPAAERMFGWTNEEMLGRVLHDAVHPECHDAGADDAPAALGATSASPASVASEAAPAPTTAESAAATAPAAASMPAPSAAAGTAPAVAPADDDDDAPCALSTRFRAGEAVRSHEDVFVCRDGSTLHVACSNAPILDDDGRVTGAVVVAHDVSGRVRMEQTLRNSEARLGALLNQAGVAIAQTDLDGRYLLVNQRYCRLVGRTTRELLEMRMQDVTHPEDLAENEANLGELADGGPDRVIEKRYLRPDGTVVWGDASVTVVRDGRGQPQSVLAVVQDVTDRKAVEAALREAKDAADGAREAAEASGRAKDRFLAVLSHELRTPLTPVLTAVQMLERDVSMPADARESLTMIRRNVELEARLIDDLLDLNRIAHGKLQIQPSECDVHEKLRSVAHICDSDARAKGVRLTLRFDAPRHHVRGDGARLQQVFWNLVKNAIKFTPEGGHIDVGTSCDPGACCDPVATAAGRANGADRLLVTVRDSGVGIDPAVMPRIFDAFEQGDRSVTRVFGGLGLGLAITRALVDLHGGTIAAASDGPGRGACFTVTLPLAAEPAATSPAPTGGGGAAEAREAARRRRGGVDDDALAGAKILLVEDDVDSARILARLLRRSGAAVQTADSVASALQVALADRHDLLISDIGLPDGSGLDLMRQLVAARGDASCPAIALSGFGMEEDVRRSRDAGFAEHLTKPVNLDHLHDAIKRVMTANAPRGAAAAAETLPGES